MTILFANKVFGTNENAFRRYDSNLEIAESFSSTKYALCSAEVAARLVPFGLFLSLAYRWSITD